MAHLLRTARGGRGVRKRGNHRLSLNEEAGHEPNAHSRGEILGDELGEAGLTARKLADILQLPADRMDEMLAGQRDLTADTALRLARYFGTSPDFWMNLQTSYELDLARRRLGSRIQSIPRRQHGAVGTRT